MQSPGDLLMLTAAVRDLHKANPGKFITCIKTAIPELWSFNPNIARIEETDPEASLLECHYPAISTANQRPLHFIHGFALFLEQQLGVRIPVTAFRGDIHLGIQEILEPPAVPGKYWIVFAGGKRDFSCKWWAPDYYQKVVDIFKSRIQFVQVGETEHWHTPLNGVVNLLGKTHNVRNLMKLVYHSQGILCPVTFGMHLAAAVPIKPGAPALRPCVVISGGREPAHWEAYPGHRFLENVGALPCCAAGGCWRSRCQLMNDGDGKDLNACERPIEIANGLRIPKCMQMITPEVVASAIESYYIGGALKY